MVNVWISEDLFMKLCFHDNSDVCRLLTARLVMDNGECVPCERAGTQVCYLELTT